MSEEGHGDLLKTQMLGTVPEASGSAVKTDLHQLEHRRNRAEPAASLGVLWSLPEASPRQPQSFSCFLGT